MNKTLGNFLTQANRDFPLDCETLDYLQKLAGLAALAGNIAGDRVVLCGCEVNDEGTRRNEGYVFVRTAGNPDGDCHGRADRLQAACMCGRRTWR